MESTGNYGKLENVLEECGGGQRSEIVTCRRKGRVVNRKGFKSKSSE